MATMRMVNTMMRQMAEKFNLPTSGIGRFSNELDLSCKVFIKEDRLLARQIVETTGKPVEDFRFAGTPGYLYTPESSEHPSYAEVDLSTYKPRVSEVNPEVFVDGSAVMAIFTVESYKINGNAGFKMTLRELIHLTPFVLDPSLSKVVGSPPKRFRLN
jgi:hypothetical protein